MPIYEYACQKCGHQFEALQKVSDGALRKCPACGALRLKKLVSAPQFRLKGTGWYETDFKKDKQRKLAGDGPDAASRKSDDQASDDKKSDAGKAGDKKSDAGAAKDGDGKKDAAPADEKAGKKDAAKDTKKAGGDKPAAKSGTRAGT